MPVSLDAISSIAAMMAPPTRGAPEFIALLRKFDLAAVYSEHDTYPAIAHKISRVVYTNTQSRIHVIVTHAFLRSLANLELEPSRVGALRAVAEAAITPAARR